MVILSLMLNKSFMRHSLFPLARLILIIAVLMLSACDVSPRVMAQERLFPNLSLEFLGEYQLPKTKFADTPVGGLSAISYEPKTERFLVLSDDRSEFAPARFYTVNLKLKTTPKPTLEGVEFEKVTFLTDAEGKTYSKGMIDTEGLVISPRQTVFISSEGVPKLGVNPFINEYDRSTGKFKQSIRVPQRFLLDAETPQGVQENLGFEALTLNPNSLAADDPFRLFTAPESALKQDVTDEPSRIRFLHYVINPFGDPILVAEHLYLLDESPDGSISNGLTELIALPQEGYFLSLERTFGLTGAGAKIFQLVIGNATDTSRIANLNGDISSLQPIRKKLLLDLSTLGIELDNLEAMTIGPSLPGGGKSLVLVSDDNFSDKQVTQFLLFRLK